MRNKISLSIIERHKHKFKSKNYRVAILFNVLVIGTRNDTHQSILDWDIKGVEREIGESWTGETYAFSVDEIIEVEEIKEVI